MANPPLKLVPIVWAQSEREAMLLQPVTMAEIRDAAGWLGITFREAYAERAAAFRRRYHFLR